MEKEAEERRKERRERGEGRKGEEDGRAGMGERERKEMERADLLSSGQAILRPPSLQPLPRWPKLASNSMQ